MSVIHVRSVPEDLVALLQDRAKGHHRSMEAEVREILRKRHPAASRLSRTAACEF